MARPKKVGLDYFELDCQVDDKIRLIQAEFGLIGFAIVVKLFQRIYGQDGYYCEWNKDILLLFMSENGVSSDKQNLINEIVNACVRRGIFSKEHFQKYGILTSYGIQKRYLNATAKRESVTMKKEYLMFTDGNFVVSDTKTGVSDTKTRVSSVGNTQSRVEKSKEKKNIKKKNRFNDFEQRDYDMDEIERKLMDKVMKGD